MSDTERPTAYKNVLPGDPLPRFRQLCQGIQFAPDAMAGRTLVFGFYGADDAVGRRAVAAVEGRGRARFDDARASVFLVGSDAADHESGRFRDSMPGLRFMWDLDGAVGELLGAAPLGGDNAAALRRRFWMVVDPSLHVSKVIPFAADGSDADALFDHLDGLPQPASFAGFEVPAPVLVLPNVFDPDLCRHLIGLYDGNGGGESGVMRGGVGVFDRSFKSRKDYAVEDQGLIRHLQGLIARRVLPEIERLFFLKITRMERYMVGCYAAEDGGHFRPHRDNSSPVTAHRRFAVSINLNADFDGGAVSFPEYNSRGIKAPPGWAVVFPANILHAVSRVTRGRRYAFLPFVYDEAGAAIRDRYLADQAKAAKVA
ncbi:2OG-Fe(II) oxygenase [Lichenibacterium ramalinae]|uniref:2OG-Fe(II) oxygenase n=1 Tax=Lichenibacterium ramalinae TaxID=2316527 RepID=A0A4Q2R717_9HYPH|nr:2OG-Fe(II) oxygenase [Lichenibacterium ramalinae]RYB02184.1 2OG-Fe(II) oxygenase [Lichenibacterium ramalinae]